MNVPNFLIQDGESLLFNLDDSEFLFYIPEDFFEDSKSSIAIEDGGYVTTIGICSWAIVDKNGRRGPIKLMNFPSLFMCKPYMIEKVKGIKLDDNYDEDDYRVLHFRKGDEVVSQLKVPKALSNCELFMNMVTLKAKMPNSIPYDEGWKLFIENAAFNGFSYNLSAQLFGLVWMSVCRDPNNIAQSFRFTDSKNMNEYKPVSLKLIPNFISPYSAIISEGWDEGIQSAILMKDKKDTPYSPLEKVLMQ